MTQEKQDNDVIVRALVGYVLIICIFLVVPTTWGVDLAVKLVNGITPLFFLALGGVVYHYLVLAWSKLLAYSQRKTP